MNDASKLQQDFLEGVVPKGLNGFYKGKLIKFFPRSTVEQIAGFIVNFWLPWYGKTFYSAKARGENVVPSYLASFITSRFGEQAIIKKEVQGLHVFPFKTTITKGLKDKIQVLRLNYDLPQNPPQVRQVVDELVRIDKNKYLGKAYIVKGRTIYLAAFFSLEK